MSNEEKDGNGWNVLDSYGNRLIRVGAYSLSEGVAMTLTLAREGRAEVIREMARTADTGRLYVTLPDDEGVWRLKVTYHPALLAQFTGLEQDVQLINPYR